MSVLIHSVTSTASTNEDVRAMAAAGHPEGTWLRADAQSAGRGRQGRDWLSPPGNLYASTLVRLQPHDPPAPTLALVAAVALKEVVRVCLVARGLAVDLLIKWPNDLLLGGAKLSGILLEREGDAVVIGFGVNLVSAPDLPDRSASSLAAAGAVVSPADFLLALAESVARWLAVWRERGLGPIRTEWLDRAHPVGTPLSVRDRNGHPVQGDFGGLTADGALRLRTSTGETVVHAGDVFLIG